MNLTQMTIGRMNGPRMQDRRWFAYALAVALGMPLHGGFAEDHAGRPDSCAAPQELYEGTTKLPKVTAALATHRPLTIVAIGGASTVGLAASGPDLTYPHRLEEFLRSRFPSVMTTVINKGAPYQTTQEMVARFPRDVLALKPDLVVWETGTMDAVRSTDRDEFSRSLQNGIDALQTNGVDLILMDMQYARDTASVIDFQSYRDSMRAVADANDVPLLRRYEMMRYWSDQGAIALDEVPRTKISLVADQVYGCLAERLADMIVAATR